MYTQLFKKHIVKHNERGRALVYISYDPKTLDWELSDLYFHNEFGNEVEKFRNDVALIKRRVESPLELERIFKDRALQLLEYFFVLEKEWEVFGLPAYFSKINGEVDFELINQVNELADFEPEPNKLVPLELSQNRRAIETIYRLAQDEVFCQIHQIHLKRLKKNEFISKLRDPLIISYFLNSVEYSALYGVFEPYSESILFALSDKNIPTFAVVIEEEE